MQRRRLFETIKTAKIYNKKCLQTIKRE